ncbi:alpha/beta fold hydrolase [Maribacter sp. Asnod2-G09]|uniref:alpha/beta fold hydrolase n=1 Tax=Maribacter sp. Asnod2-G09 TaxID=3160577 RepID=UPI0038704D90
MSSRYFLLCLLLITLSQAVSSQSGKFESFDGTEIAYTDEGSGEAILLLHGFINSRQSWDKTALKKDLLNAGYRVIIPDLRGNGDSDKPQTEEAYQDNAEVKDVLLLMNHLNIEKYKAVGYSRGSIVLAKLLTEDDSIEKAVLGGMGIDFTNADWDRRIMFAKAFDDEVNEMTKGAVDYAKSIHADLRSLHLQQKFQPVTSVSELNKIEIDVKVICGDEDNDNGNAQELSTAFKNGSLKRVPGDHNGAYKTIGFSLAVLQFLD